MATAPRVRKPRPKTSRPAAAEPPPRPATTSTLFTRILYIEALEAASGDLTTYADRMASIQAPVAAVVAAYRAAYDELASETDTVNLLDAYLDQRDDTAGYRDLAAFLESFMNEEGTRPPVDVLAPIDDPSLFRQRDPSCREPLPGQADLPIMTEPEVKPAPLPEPTDTPNLDDRIHSEAAATQVASGSKRATRVSSWGRR